MRGPRRASTLHAIAAGHAFIPNLRRDHYELAIDNDPAEQVPATFDELAINL